MRRFLVTSVAVVSMFAAVPALAQTSRSYFTPDLSILARPSPNSAVKPWAEWWAGGSMQNNAYGGYVGGDIALNAQRNVWDTGPILRGEFAAGHYDFPSGVISSGAADGTYNMGAMLFGYRAKVGAGLLGGFVGVNYQNDNVNDPTSKIQGTKAGVKLVGEYYTPLGTIFDFWGQIAYTTVYDTFTIAARPGMLVAKDMPNAYVSAIRIGPDFAYFSNDVPYRQYQVGAFAQFQLRDAISNVTLAGGFRDPTTPNSPSGYYANIGFYHPFR